MTKAFHIVLHLVLLAMVAALMWLCEAWSTEYQKLQAEQQKAGTVALRVLDSDVWVLVHGRHIYRFPGACTAQTRTDL